MESINKGAKNKNMDKGLSVLARIIAREEIKKQSAKIDWLLLFASIRGISNNDFIKNRNKIYYQNNKIKEGVR